VIVDRANDDTDTSFFGNNFLHTSPASGAIEGLRALAVGGFGARVYIVTKCGPTVENKTRQWLLHHEVYGRTGIDPAHLHVTRTREDKAPIAVRLGLTHFVDDHLDVLGHLRSVPHRYLFLGGLPPGSPAPSAPRDVRTVASWPDLVALALSSLQLGPPHRHRPA